MIRNWCADAKVNADEDDEDFKMFGGCRKKKACGCCTRGDKVKEVTMNETKALDQTELAVAGQS